MLRRVRGRLRDLLPSPDTGPSPEERERQRQRDALKGFTYFDAFDQLETWTPASSDPLQAANTPLLRRPTRAKPAGASVLLCHDYAGNYHDYEHCQGVGVDAESYVCEYLQYVDAFVYFSHKLVCVPPPSWTNALHRNGVTVLGTFLVEPGSKEVERMLRSDTAKDGTRSFPVASQLAGLAKHHGFDGWLMNIETPFPESDWHLERLLAFLRALKEQLGAEGKVVWYASSL